MRAPAQEPPKPIQIFYAYAHEDESLRLQLEKHLSLLRRRGLIENWHDQQILPGAEWTEVIDQQLQKATIILLLISADFLASDHCYEKLVSQALEQHQHKKAIVLPILLRPCDWQNAPFAHLRCLPPHDKPITQWDDQEVAFAEVAKGIRQTINSLPSSLLPQANLSSLQHNNRQSLLKQVKFVWIQGIRDKSLQDVPLIPLVFQENPTAVSNPWRETIQETDLLPPPLPAGTDILQIYDDAEGGLLLLGDPGAGKTIQMLELTCHLIDRAEKDIAHPMPVIFNLSSWAIKKQPFESWLIEELKIKYSVPEKLGRTWLRDKQILPLLDGLDEVIAIHRSACIEAMNLYHQKHPLVPLVICSRKHEYEEQNMQLEVQRALIIQPLTTQQIDEYLLTAGEQGQSVQTLLAQHPIVRELATSPFMLTILTRFDQKASLEEHVADNPADVQRSILNSYTHHALARRTKQRYTQEQTVQWLSWLAQQMKMHHQTEFSFEQMQSNWLTTKQQQIYRTGLMRIRYALAALVGILAGIALGQIFGPVDAIMSGLLFGLLCLQISGLQTSTIEPTHIVVWSLRNVWLNLRTFFFLIRHILLLILSLLLLPFIGIGALFRRLHLTPEEVPVKTLNWHVNIFDGESITRLSHTIADYHFKIVTSIDLMYRSVKKLDGGFFGGLLIYAITQASILTWLALIVAIIGITGGISNQALPHGKKATRKEGMRQAVHQSIRIGLILGILFSLVGGPIFSALLAKVLVQTVTPSHLLACILLIGLVGFIMGSLRGGGAQCIKHFLLRGILERSGALPRHYPRFLNYAAERILLRKVGNDYIFVHGLLLDYFVDLNSEMKTSAAVADHQIEHKSGNILSAEHSDELHHNPLNDLTKTLKERFGAIFSAIHTSQYSEQKEPAPSHASTHTTTKEETISSSSTQSTNIPSPPASKAPKRHYTRREVILTVWLVVTLVIALFEFFLLTNTTTSPSTTTSRTALTATATASILNQMSTNIPNNATAEAKVKSGIAQFQDHYKQLTQGMPNFNDPMTDSNDNNWDNFANLSGGCKFTDRAYHVTISQPSQPLVESCFEKGLDFGNLVLQVQMQMDQGSYGGLYFRFDLTKRHGYSFSLRADGTYALSIISFTTTINQQPLVTGQIASIVKGQRYQMAVVVQDNNFDLYVNGLYIGSAHDNNNTSPSGKIGLFAANDVLNSPIADIAYTNVEVWR